MSEIEKLLTKAYKKGYYQDVMKEAEIIKQANPKMDLEDRYSSAYSKIKSQNK